MDEKIFECIKRDLSVAVIRTAIDRHGWSEDEAIRRFMNSTVYDCLQREDTHVWHYSRVALANLFEDELGGHLVWPEAP